MKRSIQRLDPWITFPEAAKLLNMSNQGFHKMVEETGIFSIDDLRKVGSGSKPIYLVNIWSVKRVIMLRELAIKRNKDMSRVLEQAMNEPMG